jgi:anaerobic selenocysteine-containing dehydrogenase
MLGSTVVDRAIGYTFCDGCNHGPFCGIKFSAQDGIVTAIEEWPGFPVNKLCQKGYATLQRLHHPDRLLYPQLRTTPKGRDPAFKRISWDEAYDLIVRELTRIRAEHGPEKVFFYIGDPKEPRAVVQRLAAAYGSPNYGTESWSCRRAAQMAEGLTFGFSTLGNPPTPETRSMLLWGVNPAYTREPPQFASMLAARERGAKVIVVDPRITPASTILADLHLRPRPSTDGALAAGMMHVILAENRHDRAFCAGWIHGFDQLSRYVADFPPARVEALTGVPADQVIAAARLFSEEQPGILYTSSQATTHNRNAVNNHRAILLVAAVCGSIEVPGGLRAPQPDPAGLGPWSGGNRKLGLQERLIAVREKRLDLPAHPLWAETTLEVTMGRFPEWVAEGKLRAFLGWGLNAMLFPQTGQVQRALDRLDFVMAADYFYRPQTHAHVDLLLPAAQCYERMAPFGVFKHRLFARQTVKPAGEAREDWQIALEIGARLIDPELFFQGSVEAALDSLLAPLGQTWKALQAHLEDGVQLPFTPRPPRAHEAGLLRADGKPGFATPTGKIEAISTAMERHGYPGLPVYIPPEATSTDFPLQMITGTRPPHIVHSKWRSDSPWLNELGDHPELLIHPDDAKRRSLADGDTVEIRSAQGRIEAVAMVTIEVPAGVVGMMHGWAGANVNELISRDVDPVSGFPPYKDVPVEVSRTHRRDAS